MSFSPKLPQLGLWVIPNCANLRCRTVINGVPKASIERTSIRFMRHGSARDAASGIEAIDFLLQQPGSLPDHINSLSDEATPFHT
jgi:hypothetical protein